MISQVLTGQLPVTPSGKEEAEKQCSEIDKAHMPRMMKTLSAGGVVLFLGLVFMVISKKMLHNELLTMVGTLIILTGVFIMGYGVFSAMWRSTTSPGQLSTKKGQTQPELDNGIEVKRLAEPMLSVTERTTKLMESGDREDSKKEVRVEQSAKQRHAYDGNDM